MSTAYQALRTSAAWIDLTPRGKILVTGEDAARLLHAMSTNDIHHLAPGQGLYAFFLNDKGRILADANIFRLGNEFFLDTEPETAAKIYQHLDKYIIADDAYISDETASWFKIGIEGPASLAVMQTLGLSAPSWPFEILTEGHTRIARLASTGPLGFRIWTPDDRLAQQLAAAGIPQATHAEARIVRLENGVPRYGEDISERYLVQETQALHAVHFSKGCYLGQEIVERVRSQGKVHRLLKPIQLAGENPPPAGTKLLLGDTPAGEITSAAYSPALHKIVAMAYMRTEVGSADTLRTAVAAEAPAAPTA
jgi:aminomethyltransferase